MTVVTMLKIAGAFLAVAAAYGFGNSLAAQQQERKKQLFSLKEMTTWLSGEIRYGCTPLEDAFLHVSERVGEPLSKLLAELGEKLREDAKDSLAVMWTDVFQRHKKEFVLNSEEWELALSMGNNLGFLDAQTQLAHLELYEQQLNNYLQKLQEGMKEQQRLYRLLSLFAGVFVVIILL